MRIVLIILLAGTLVSWNTAYAVDLWEDDPVISEDPAASDTTAETTEVSTASQLQADPEHLGMYFGADGQLTTREAGWPQSGRTFDYNGQQVIYPEYAGAYSGENVYGPMWGVPGDAVGLDGYDPFYYYVLSGGDISNLTPEQRQMLEARIRSGELKAPAATETTGEADGDPATLEGINLTDDYWD